MERYERRRKRRRERGRGGEEEKEERRRKRRRRRNQILLHTIWKVFQVAFFALLYRSFRPGELMQKMRCMVAVVLA